MCIDEICEIIWILNLYVFFLQAIPLSSRREIIIYYYAGEIIIYLLWIKLTKRERACVLNWNMFQKSLRHLVVFKNIVKNVYYATRIEILDSKKLSSRDRNNFPGGFSVVTIFDFVIFKNHLLEKGIYLVILKNHYHLQKSLISSLTLHKF